MDAPEEKVRTRPQASEPEDDVDDETDVVFEPSPKLVEEVNMEQPSRRRAQAEREDDDADAYVPKPAKPATPGVYTYAGKQETWHAKLGLLKPGKNDYSGMTHPEELQAVGELVAAGMLTKA